MNQGILTKECQESAGLEYPGPSVFLQHRRYILVMGYTHHTVTSIMILPPLPSQGFMNKTEKADKKLRTLTYNHLQFLLENKTLLSELYELH